MEYLSKCFLLWMSLVEIVQFCTGHPRVSHDLQVNHTAAALTRLLQLFGIERNQLQPRRHPHPPQYMLDLYRSFTEGSSAAGGSLRFHHGANTVRSFYEKGSSAGNGHYQFDLSNAISDQEDVMEAQFHFFTNRNIPRSHQSSNVIQIRLYEGMLNSTFSLLEARLVSAYVPGWEVFKVTHSVKKWILGEEFNKGLTVQVLDGPGQAWTNRRSHLQSYRPPILIVFSQDSKRAATHHSSTRHRNIHQPEFHANQNPTPEPDLQEVSMRSARSAAIPTTGDCTRHELRVDFEKLGWSNWIISPKWYDAYVCSGACAFPLGQNQRPTNHATVQSIVHELGLTAGVGAPCCVPTELHSVSLLYFDENMNVVLKQYDDMIASGCGCQ